MTDILKIINELGINKQFLPIIYCLLLLGALYKPLKSFWDDISRSRLNNLKEAHNFNGHDKGTKKFLKTSLSEEYFKLATGLSLGFGYQEKLMELYLKNKAPVAFHHYKRVAEYFKFDDDKNIISIKIPKLSQTIGYCQAILGFYLLGSVVLFLFRLLDIRIKNFHEILVLIGIVILLWMILLFGFFCILKPYSIYKSSVYVNKQIGSTDFTCFYHRALEKKTLRLLFYIPIPALALFLVFVQAYFQTTSA
jgi:hypothetical protein